MKNEKKKFVAFGEIMFRLTPSREHDLISRSQAWLASYAGAESNVASSLSSLGHEAHFCTVLPQNALGDGAIYSLHSYGVHTNHILRAGDRMGTYFIESGISIRPSKVVYDRKYSAISQMSSGDIDWKTVLQGKDWLHLGGITPALSNVCAEESIRAARTAQEMNVKVSFDFNFRRSLWSSADRAREIFSEILHYSDLLLANEGSIKDVYGFQAEGDSMQERTVNLMKKMSTEYQIPHLAFTTRDHSSASMNTLGAFYYQDGEVEKSPEYNVNVKDRLGTGDAFGAGILHGIGQEWAPRDIVAFGAAAFALKHTVPGDQHPSSERDIMSIVKGNITGHIER